MHRHVEWDAPGAASVLHYYEHDPASYPEPRPGSILSARYRGRVVRMRVEAYVDGTSIGKVVAVIDPDTGERRSGIDQLQLGDMVRLPDEWRAFEPAPPAGDAADAES
ncbi:hypothetical protein EQG41_06850 [Billgrantia azerbaijanica]|nr:hypothetical protein EQG41_06850 [Halomonas azerbaijanica]